MAAAVNLSHGSWVQPTPVGGLLRLRSSFSRIGAPSPRGRHQWACLYDRTLIGLGRGICDQAEPIMFSLLGIQHLGQRLRSLGMIILLSVKLFEHLLNADVVLGTGDPDHFFYVNIDFKR